MPFDITFLSLFCVCLLVIALEALNLRKLARKIRIQGHTLTELRQELEALLLCDRGMGDRIKQQQKQVRCMIERQDNLEISNSSNTSYKQAMVLLRKGASTDELIDACDLSRGELELLSRLKSASETSTPTHTA